VIKHFCYSIVIAVLVASCQTTSLRQKFVTACSTVGEAMVQVINARRAGQIDTATYIHIDDLYDAAVKSCDTLPPTDDAAALALDRVDAFLTAATGATGVNDGSY
jgi:hypothetical protein